MSAPNPHSGPVLCIVCPQLGAPSETFIKKHIDLIAPTRTVVLTGTVLEPGWVSCPVKQIPMRIGRYHFTPDEETEVLQFLRQKKVTHILCEFGSIGGAVLELNQTFLHLPAYVHFHGQDASEYLRMPEMVDYYRWMGQIVDGVIVVSQPMRDRLSEIGIPRDKFRVISYGVDVPQRDHAHPEIEPCRLIAVSRLIPKKGLLFTLMAFEHAVRQVGSLSLDIIGDGPMQSAIESFIKKHNLQSKVTLHGALPHEAVLALMDKSSLFVQHSIIDPETGNREGRPVSVIEAAAHALPVVATRHEGIPETVDEGLSGYLVSERDWKSMAKHIVKLAKYPTMRKKMGLAGRKKTKVCGFSTEASTAELRRFMRFPTMTGPSERRNILFVNHAIPPYENSGTPITTLNHARGLQERGHKVAILIPSLGEVHVGFKKEIQDGLTIYRVPVFDKQKAFLGSIDKEALNFYLATIAYITRDFGPDIVHINDYVGMPADIIALFHDMGCVVVRNVCNDEEICHQDYPVIASGTSGKLCSGPKSADRCAVCYLQQFHAIKKEHIQQNNKESLSRILEKRMKHIQKLYREKVDAVVFTSKPFKKHFTSFVPITEKKIHIIPRGFSLSHPHSLIQPEKAGAASVRFAFFGTLMFSKGIDVLLKAFERIAAIRTSFRLDLHGIPVHPDFNGWVRRLEEVYPDRIKSHGEFQPEQFSDLIRRVDVAIVPSYFDTYNRVVRECLYYGVPVISSDFFGSFIIRNGDNGLKIPIGDDKALAAAMKRLIDKPRLIETLREGAQTTEIPTLDDEIEALMGLYEMLLPSRRIKQPKRIPGKKKGRKTISFGRDSWSKEGDHYMRDIDHLLQSILENNSSLLVRFPCTLFIDTGAGFSEQETVRERITRSYAGKFQVAFDLRGFRKILAVRLDPWEGFWGRLRLDEIVAELEPRRKQQISVAEVRAINGELGPDGFYTFRTCDPILEIPGLVGRIAMLTIQGSLEPFDALRMEAEWAGESTSFREKLAAVRAAFQEQLAEKDRDLHALQQLLSVAKIVRGWHDGAIVTKPLVLFGTGSLADWVLQLLDRNRCQVRCCFDNRPRTATFCGFDVQKPSFIPGVQIIIASMHDIEIKKQLRNLGYCDDDLISLRDEELKT